MFFGRDDPATETTTLPFLTTTNDTEAAEIEMTAYQPIDATTVPVLIAVIAVIVIFLVSVIAYRQIRRRKQAERQKRVQLRMSTTDNAGVYVDLSPPEPGAHSSKRRSQEL